MAPKKKKANGFWSLALRLKAKYRISQDEALKRAAEEWKTLTAEEKERFKKDSQFELESRAGASQVDDKLNVVKEIHLHKMTTRKLMIEDIKTFVKKSNEDNNLIYQSYYVIHMNYFVHFLGQYIPAEIAIVEFNIQDGILNSFHEYINPITLPMGSALDAKEHYEQLKLPLPPNAMGISNYDSLWEKIMDFTQTKYPPLYTTESNIPAVQKMMDLFKAEAFDQNNFRIYDIAYLMSSLKEAASKKSTEVQLRLNTNFTVNIANGIYKTDKFANTLSIGCDHHDTEDVSRNCSLSMVKRFTYYISEVLETDLKLLREPGTHYPSITADDASSIEIKTEIKVELEEILPKARVPVIPEPVAKQPVPLQQLLDPRLNRAGRKDPRIQKELRARLVSGSSTATSTTDTQTDFIPLELAATDTEGEAPSQTEVQRKADVKPLPKRRKSYHYIRPTQTDEVNYMRHQKYNI